MQMVRLLPDTLLMSFGLLLSSRRSICNVGAVRSSCFGRPLLALQCCFKQLHDDAHKRIQFPPHPYGYRTEPFCWDEIQRIVDSNDLARFSRSVESQRDYELYKRHVLDAWNTIMDHVLVEKFPSVFSKVAILVDTCHKFVAYPSLETVIQDGVQETTLVKNDFPYFVDQNIQHWVLWKLGGACDTLDIQLARKRLCGEQGAIDVVHWVNPIPLKSIPEIDHVHFLTNHSDEDKSVYMQQCSQIV